MRTKEQLVGLIATRLESKIYKTSKFSDLVASISSATQAQKQHLVDLIVSSDTKKVGELLEKALKAHTKALSIAEANNILSDDTLSLVELDKII